MPASVPYSSNTVLIIGGPGSGRTSLINQLQKHGFATQPNVTHALSKHQQQKQGIFPPFSDPNAYFRLLTRNFVTQWHDAMQQHPDYVFCDGGLPDIQMERYLCNQPFDRELQERLLTYRYHKKVFVLPPWAEIFKTDQTNCTSFAKALQAYIILRKTCHEAGYQIIEVRKDNLLCRAELILRHLGLSPCTTTKIETRTASKL